MFLGHVISEEGIHTNPEKIAAVQKLQPPTCVKELRRCLGIASCYRQFVPNFATVVQPMSQMLCKRLWLRGSTNPGDRGRRASHRLCQSQTHSSGGELFGHGELVLGDHLGHPQASLLPGRVSLHGHYLPSGPEVAEYPTGRIAR